MNSQVFSGLITALITPFKSFTREIDFPAVERLLDLQLAAAVDGIVIAGSTGEALSLSYDELLSLVQFTIKYVNGRLPVIAGCCAANINTVQTIIKDYEKLSVQGVMCTTPFYLRPNQDGLYNYFKNIHDSCNLPIILYNAPERTGISINHDTIIKLSGLQRIVAIKDAAGDLTTPLQIQSQRDINNEFSILCGVDSLALGFNAQGGSGVISVASNIAPFECKKIQELWHNGQVDAALQLHKKLMLLYQAMDIDTNPVAVKYAASLYKLCEADVRLPLTSLTKDMQNTIKNVLHNINIKLTVSI